MNKKVIADSKGRKYFTTNKFHTKIFNDEFFPNYGMYPLVTNAPTDQ